MKVVGVIPAGRRKYMECLVPYLLRDRVYFDRIELWNNAAHEDVPYLESLVDDYPDLFELVPLPLWHSAQGYYFREDPNDPDHRVGNVHLFYHRCVDPDTLYIKFDDDIVWVQEGAIARLIERRLAEPKWWMVIGNIVNNSATWLLHQGKEVDFDCEYDGGIYKSPAAAEEAHTLFFNRLEAGDLGEYDFGLWDSGYVRQVPNQVYAFMGRDWAHFGGRINHNDEYWWLTVHYPSQVNRWHCIEGSALFCHYSYRPQEPHLSDAILKQYRHLAEEVMQAVKQKPRSVLP